MLDGIVGRAVTFTWNGVTIPGVREKDVTLNGAAIDVTSGENNGKRTLLTVSAEDQVDIKITGVTKSDALKNDWMAGTRTRAVQMTYPNGAIMTGTFYMTVYAEKGTYKDAVTFDATLLSAQSDIAYTPGT